MLMGSLPLVVSLVRGLVFPLVGWIVGRALEDCQLSKDPDCMHAAKEVGPAGGKGTTCMQRSAITRRFRAHVNTGTRGWGVAGGGHWARRPRYCTGLQSVPTPRKEHHLAEPILLSKCFLRGSPPSSDQAQLVLSAASKGPAMPACPWREQLRNSVIAHQLCGVPCKSAK